VVASANVLESANAEANAIVASFMVVLPWYRTGSNAPSLFLFQNKLVDSRCVTALRLRCVRVTAGKVETTRRLAATLIWIMVGCFHWWISRSEFNKSIVKYPNIERFPGRSLE
jgi:hypothetical protein